MRHALLVVLLGGAIAAGHDDGPTLVIELQRRDPKTGKIVVTKETLHPEHVGIVVVDLWNFHWCKTAAERVGCMVPRMNKALQGARSLGMQVFLCPTDVADSYVGTTQRERAVAAKLLPLPKPVQLEFPRPRGGGRMCGPGISCVVNYGWDGMQAGLTIARDDLIAEGTQQLYSLCRARGITHLLYMGVHTNMCVMGKSVGMVPMMRTGLKCVLCRDLTDAYTDYNPQSGYTPDRGTAEVVAHIERHILPSIDMAQTLKGTGFWDDDWRVDPVRVTPWGTKQRPHQFERSTTVTLSSPLTPNAQIHFTVDGSAPTTASPRYERPLVLTQTTEIRALAFRDGKPVGLEGAGFFVKLPPGPWPADAHLSDLKPLRQAGGFERRKTAANRSYAGTELRVRGVRYAKGLGVHAPSHVVYAIPPDAERFVALAGIDDAVRDRNMGREQAMYPSVIFRIFLDGTLVAASPVQRISQEPWRFDFAIPEGTRTLSLTVTDAGDGNRHDLADWVNAGFLLPGWRDRANTIPVPGYWEQDPRYAGYDGFAWYRCYVRVPASWKDKDLTLMVPALDNCHEAYFNGTKVGGAGSMPPKYANGLDTEKPCTVAAKLVRPGQWNLLAIRAYDAGGAGGFRDGPPTLAAGKQQIALEGRWEFRKGDDMAWANRPADAEPPKVGRFELRK